MSNELETVKQQWDDQAGEWNQWIGDEGDSNRRDSSDSYLWKYIGNIDDKVVLDAGCGNGYLTVKFALETNAKQVIGVDLSSSLVQLAKENLDRRVIDIEQHRKVQVYQDSITELKTIEDNSVDLIVSNYVLMDTPDLESVVKSFERVLKPSGRVVFIILHPCFDRVPEKDGVKRMFVWTKSYFDETVEQQIWGPFCLNMYHRSLSVYFKMFHQYGLTLVDFDEPKFYSKLHGYDFTCAALFHFKK